MFFKRCEIGAEFWRACDDRGCSPRARAARIVIELRFTERNGETAVHLAGRAGNCLSFHVRIRMPALYLYRRTAKRLAVRFDDHSANRNYVLGVFGARRGS